MAKPDKYSVVVENQIAKCLEYSDNPESLKSLINELQVYVKFEGVMKHFVDEEKKREVITVAIIRNGRTISFKYGLSMLDTAQIGLLYYYTDYDAYDVIINGRTKNISTKPDWGSRPAQIDEYLKCFYGLRKNYQVWDVLTQGSKQLKKPSELYKPIGLLYGILCSVRNDTFIPISFKSFCEEYGYNNDSIKHRALWESCLEQSAILQEIFRVEDMNILPS